MAILGNFISKVSLKWYIIIGMILSSLCYASFAVYYEITGILSYPIITTFMCLNGFFQATGWPGMMGVFGNWFTKGKKGIIMGIWAINANFGNIVA
jgi:sugar phosphate permease